MEGRTGEGEDFKLKEGERTYLYGDIELFGDHVAPEEKTAGGPQSEGSVWEHGMRGGSLRHEPG
jgi:hypothetical protein